MARQVMVLRAADLDNATGMPARSSATPSAIQDVAATTRRQRIRQSIPLAAITFHRRSYIRSMPIGSASMGSNCGFTSNQGASNTSNQDNPLATTALGSIQKKHGNRVKSERGRALWHNNTFQG